MASASATESVMEAELAELRKTLENAVPDSKLVTCVASSIRVEITKSEFKKFVICLTYPSNYPEHHVLVELRSKTLSTKLLDGLVKVSEAEAKKHTGRPHCLHVVKFINSFFEDNPLSVCSDELAECKKMLDVEGPAGGGGQDRFKLSQKTSSVSLYVAKERYFFKAKVTVPHEYPNKQVVFDKIECNFPRVFKTWFAEQAREVARRCVQPPLKPRPKAPPFTPRPSLAPAVSFLIQNVKRYPVEACQACGRRAFPEDPDKAVHDEHAAAHVERVYCSHIYHHDCLILYMKTPPFQGGKKCKACSQRIFHEKWKVTPELAEARWAHEQAKNRELGEVVDFLGELANIS